jgi:hypothetical protein
MADRRIRITVEADSDGSFDGAARGLDGVDKSATRANSSLGELSKGHRALDAEIDKVGHSLKDVRTEFERTGDLGLLGDARKLEQTQKRLQSFRRDLQGVSHDVESVGAASGGLLNFALDEWAAGLAKNTANGIRSGITAAGSYVLDDAPILGTALVAGAVIAAPAVASIIGTAIGTGVALGFGGGVIALGIKEAVADTRVSAAWSDLGNTARTALSQASGPFVQPLIDGAAKVKAAFVDIEPEISAAFATLAPTLNDLFDGAAGFTRAIGPGLDELANFSAPFLQDLATYLPQLGDHLKEFIDKVTNAGPGVENFFNDLLDLTLNSIDALGDLVNWGSRVYDVFSAIGFAVEGNLGAAADRISDVFGKTAQSYGGFHNSTIDANTALGLLNGTVEKAAGGTTIMKNSVDEAAGAFQKLGATTRDSLEGQAVDYLLNKTLSLDQANLSLAQSETQLGDVLKSNHTNLDITTAKGQELHSAVLAVVGANIRQYDSELAVSGSADQARASYDANTQALEHQLQAAHLTQGQIDGLIGKYRNVPDDVNTNITMQGLTTAISNLDETLRLINHLPPRRDVDIGVHTFYTYTGTPPGLAGPAVALHHQLHGGVVKAASGLNSGILPPRNPGTLVLAGEPGTKGEIFAPLSGISQSRAMQLGQQLGDAYDFSVTPNGYGGAVSAPSSGNAGVRNYYVTVAPSVGQTPQEQGAAVVKAIKAFEQSNGPGWRN